MKNSNQNFWMLTPIHLIGFGFDIDSINFLDFENPKSMCV